MIMWNMEHVPIKMETKDVEIVNKSNEEHIKDDDDVVNSENGTDDEEEPDEDEDDDEEEEEEDLESDALVEVEQEVTLLMSSDEEAELEAQRIRFPEKRTRNKSNDSKPSRSTSRNSNTSQQSSTKEQQLPAKGKETTANVVAADVQQQQQQPQRSSTRNKKQQNNKNVENLTAGDLRQVARRQSNNSTCSVASSFASDSAETESCANIYVYPQQQKLIFNCEFCDLKYGELESLGRHLHESHNLFHQNDEDQEKENSPRNLRNRGNQLPPKSHQQALSVKKEPLQTTESTSVAPVAPLSLHIHSEHSLQSCGNVFILNHRKLFLICGYCECKYGNVELFEKHLRQQHDIFEGNACNEVNVVPKTEVKEEVFIITEVVEKPQMIAADAMVTIPAEIPLNVSTSAEDNIDQVEAEIPIESEVLSSIQIRDSGVTVADIPVVMPEETSTQVVVLDSTSVMAKEDSGKPPPTSQNKRTRKCRSAIEKTEMPKSPNKRPRRNTRKTVEPEQPKPVITGKRKTNSRNKIDDKSKGIEMETEMAPAPEPQKETFIAIELQQQEQDSEMNIEPPQQEIVKDSTMVKATPIVTVTKRKRKTIKTKIEREEPPSLSIRKSRIVSELNVGIDEEFLEDPVAEIIEQIQKEINSSAEQTLIVKSRPMPPTTLPDPFIACSSPQPSLSPNMKPHMSDLSSPVDIKPILNEMGEHRFVCAQCPRSFKKHTRLIEHIRLHTGEKPFTCDECGKQFRIRIQLTEHKLRHSKQKKFTCDVCNLAVCTKQDLNLHMRHHTNDRRYQCKMCPKAFVRSSDLKIHSRVHTGEKPYVCDVCHKCFRANQNLSVHKKSHMGDVSKTFKCEHCDKKFLRNIDRKVHMRTHTGEKPFKCEICDRAYSSKFNVKAHIERDHIAERGKKKPGPKPKALRAELAKQKKLIEQLQHQLLQQIKTDEKIIPAEHSSNESGDEIAHIVVPTPTQQNESFIISELESPTLETTMSANPSSPLGLNEIFTKAQQTSATATVVPLTVTQKIEQHSTSSPACSVTPSPSPPPPPAKATTTKVVAQKTSLGIQQVSVTVSMQVENVTTSARTPEKENAGISTTTSPPTKNVKKERKITSYFTVVGQKAEG